MAKRPWREQRESGGDASTGHHGAPGLHAPISEQLSCLVVKSTPDGYAVGRALVADADVTWLTPMHHREWLETRPQDVVVAAEKWANEDGTVTLKPTRTNKGTPIQTVVGHHLVFGESADATAHRAKGELKKLFDTIIKSKRAYWRHKCPSQLLKDLPLWAATPRGEACAHCGLQEGRKVNAA